MTSDHLWLLGIEGLLLLLVTRTAVSTPAIRRIWEWRERWRPTPHDPLSTPEDPVRRERRFQSFKRFHRGVIAILWMAYLLAVMVKLFGLRGAA